MKLMNRASRLLRANLNHMLDAAEDPEVMLKDLIREMDAAIVELRRETVNAVAREKTLARKVKGSELLAEELEAKAGLALDNGDRELARQILANRVETLKNVEALTDEAEAARNLARTLKSNLLRMEEQSGSARRKKEGLIRRKKAAEAQMRTQDAARRSADAMAGATGGLGTQPTVAAFDGYADQIDEMEARAEADREMTDDRGEAQHRLDKLVESSEVDRELERLEAERNQSDDGAGKAAAAQGA